MMEVYDTIPMESMYVNNSHEAGNVLQRNEKKRWLIDRLKPLMMFKLHI